MQQKNWQKNLVNRLRSNVTFGKCTYKKMKGGVMTMKRILLSMWFQASAHLQQ